MLAVLPHVDKPSLTQNGSSELSGDFREPFRILRTNVELAAVDTPPRTIVVSSAMPGEGKSTVVRNLALAFHESGKRVAVVDLDLRHPALAGLFGVPLGRGVTDVLRRDVKLEDVMLQIGSGVPVFDEFVETNGAASNGANGHHTSTAESGVTLLLAGAPPANPPAVLASQRIVEILDELCDRYDIVLIDSAPLLAVSDTVPLLRYADATLIVGRLGVTTRDTAKRLTEFLGRVPDVTLLGVIANDLSRREAGAYGYGYGYGYGSSDTKDDRRQRKATSEPPKQPV